MNISLKQASSAVLMVRPLSFGFDVQTARTNTFQTESQLPSGEIVQRACNEFDRMAKELQRRGIRVHVHESADSRPKPNAIFPNNWLSTWPSGNVFLYPMATQSRRVERSQDIIDELSTHFAVREVIDFSAIELKQQHLESTGVIIFDHLFRVMYGCVSERCNERLFIEHALLLGYEPVLFHAYDEAGTAIYHTNVMMGLQTTTAVICSESIAPPDREIVLARLRQTGRTVVEISQAQMTMFCANVLELHGMKGERFLAMSQAAYDTFTEGQRSVLSQDKELLPFAIPTIEAVGGGSVRCMLAEIFLPPLL